MEQSPVPAKEAPGDGRREEKKTMREEKGPKLILGFLPWRAVVPMLILLAVNALAYNGTRLVTTTRFHYNLESRLDTMIPLLPDFIWVYVSAYLQWLLGYAAIGRERKDYAYRFFAADLIAKIIVLIIFLVLPTTAIRPPITTAGASEELLRDVWRLDAMDNLFPSIHCLESWICLRGVFGAKKSGAFSRFIMLIWTLGVFASTVFVQQHVLVDIPAAIVCVEIGLFLAKKWNTGRLFDRINTWLYTKIHEREKAPSLDLYRDRHRGTVHIRGSQKQRRRLTGGAA